MQKVNGFLFVPVQAATGTDPGDTNMTSPDTNTTGLILDAIKDVKSDMRSQIGSVNTQLTGMQRELGGVQTTLQNLKESNEKTEAEVSKIRDAQADCQARKDIDGVNARLKKLEKKDEDITGQIDVVSNRQEILQAGLHKNGGVRFLEAFKRVWPVIVLAVIGGAAMGGYILAIIAMGGTP